MKTIAGHTPVRVLVPYKKLGTDMSTVKNNKLMLRMNIIKGRDLRLLKIEQNKKNKLFQKPGNLSYVDFVLKLSLKIKIVPFSEKYCLIFIYGCCLDAEFPRLSKFPI